MEEYKCAESMIVVHVGPMNVFCTRPVMVYFAMCPVAESSIFLPLCPTTKGGATGGLCGPWPTQNFGWVGHTAFGPTNNWPVCSLILRKISKIGATRCQFSGKNAPNLLSAGALPQTPLGELTALPRPIVVLNGPTSKAREGKGRGWERGREGKVKEWRGSGDGGGRDLAHPKNFGVAPPMPTTVSC